METLLLCGSRNQNGQTAQAAGALLKGLITSGASVEQAFLPALKIERCRQCDDNGWGLCREKGSCVIEDDFSMIVDKIRHSDAVIFATPVYYSDMSESLRAFTDRLRRICFHETGSIKIRGKFMIGICVAGGGGGGAPACCVSLEKVGATCGFDIVDMIPVRRQNLTAKLPRLELAGQWLATRPGSEK